MTLENQNYTSIIGNPNMPYLNSLLDQGALLTNFYANFHPSQPNYFALTTGQSFYTKEGPIPTGTSHVVNALATKNKTWKGYYADVTTHEAVFRYFPEIWQNPAQLAKIVPIFPDFMRDVTTGSLPSYSIIHDLPEINGHNCTDGGLCMGPVDDRLRDTIAPYLNDPSFVANNDLLIVMFDEATLTDATCSGPTTIAMTEAARLRGAWKCGGRTVALFLGAGVKRGYQSTTLYHFEAFLRLSLEGLGVTDALPGASAFAPNMDELFENFTPTDTTPPTVAAAPLGGSFTSAQSVTLTATDNYPGTSIYFTTNGSTPTSASTRYTAPISIATTTTLKFIAIDAAGNSSAIGSETYTIAAVPPGGGALPASWQTQDIGAVGVERERLVRVGDLQPDGRRRGHLGNSRRTPVRLHDVERRRPGHRARGHRTERERVDQGRRDDSRQRGTWIAAGADARVTRQGQRVPAPRRNQRRVHAHGGRARDGALLGAPVRGSATRSPRRSPRTARRGPSSVLTRLRSRRPS